MIIFFHKTANWFFQPLLLLLLLTASAAVQDTLWEQLCLKTETVLIDWNKTQYCGNMTVSAPEIDLRYVNGLEIICNKHAVTLNL